jgi:predicted RNA-binding Zn ribbon-like protein
MVQTLTIAFHFDLTGGHPALDFANTVDDRPADHPEEHLIGYADLVAWGRQAGVLTDEQAGQLLGEAARHPARAAAVLRRAIELREAIYRILLAAANEARPASEDLDILNDALADAMARARIAPSDDGFAWGWADEGALDQMLWPVARAAADLLTSDQLARVRLCSAHDCNWLFMDASRNGSRRWCNMQSCGNRAKARRFQQRQRVKA